MGERRSREKEGIKVKRKRRERRERRKSEGSKSAENGGVRRALRRESADSLVYACVCGEGRGGGGGEERRRRAHGAYWEANEEARYGERPAARILPLPEPSALARFRLGAEGRDRVSEIERHSGSPFSSPKPPLFLPPTP